MKLCGWWQDGRPVNPDLALLSEAGKMCYILGPCPPHLQWLKTLTEAEKIRYIMTGRARDGVEDDGDRA